MVFKIVISDTKTGKSYQFNFENKAILIGRKIGDKIKGEILNKELIGYELEITGGSDSSGFPMRKDIDGVVSRRILLAKGVGFRAKRKGERRKKRVRGNIISEDVVQINMKVVKHGSKTLEEIFKKEDKEKTKETKEVE